MKRIILCAQLLGGLAFTLAAVAIADPGQGLTRRVRTTGDEPGTLKLGGTLQGKYENDVLDLTCELHRVQAGTLVRGAPPKGPMKMTWEPEWSAGSAKLLSGLSKGRRLGGSLSVANRKVLFQKGLLTEIGFPALDAASKEPAYLSLKMDTEVTDYQEGGVTAARGQQKRWLPANFKFELGGVNTAGVQKVEAMIWSNKVESKTAGRWAARSKIDLPKEAALAARWVGPGFDPAKGAFKPTNGRITFLDESKRPLLRVKFRLASIRCLGFTSAEGRSMSFELFFDTFETGTD